MRRLVPLAGSLAIALVALSFHFLLQPGGSQETPLPGGEPEPSTLTRATNALENTLGDTSSPISIPTDDWALLEVGAQVEFTLSGSKQFLGTVTEERKGRVATSFSGNLEADPRFHFTLTTGPGAQFGTVNTPAGIYEISSQGDVVWMYPREALPGIAQSVDLNDFEHQAPPLLEEVPRARIPPSANWSKP